MRQRSWLVGAAVMLLSLSCSGLRPETSSPAARAARRLPLEICQVEGVKEPLLCGRLSVLENRENPQGRRIELAILVLPALAEPVAPDPVFSLAGGPGGSATDSAGGWALEGGALRRHRDIVLVDQRGTGGSNRLDCRVPEDPRDIQAYFGPAMPVDAVIRCREKLETRADLSQYTTSIAAEDLDQVRAYLGYERINLEGGSYGTRMAQVYIRRFPERVRSAVLIGVAGMNQHLPLWHARDGQRALDLLVGRCAAEPACAAAFPQLAAELKAVLDRLDREPGRATVEIPDTSEEREVTLSRQVFAEQLRFVMYTPASAVVAPYVIHRAFANDFSPVARVAMLWEPALRRALASGMHLSVTCAEDVPFIDPTEVEAAVAGTALGDYRVRQQLAACEQWSRGLIPDNFHAPVRSDVPILLLSGAFDPVTPPRWADAALPHLSRGRHVVIPEGHHGFGGLSHQQCFDNLVTHFFTEASADHLDTSCVETMERPPFATDAASFEAWLKGRRE